LIVVDVVDNNDDDDGDGVAITEVVGTHSTTICASMITA
jgi:hypothetical protein